MYLIERPTEANPFRLPIQRANVEPAKTHKITTSNSLGEGERAAPAMGSFYDFLDLFAHVYADLFRASFANSTIIQRTDFRAFNQLA